MPVSRQTSFSAGELSPQMWGRTDKEAFAHGLATMRNFFPTRQGEAVSRGGTKFVALARVGGGLGTYRLVPFVYSDTQTYVIELSNNKARFYANGQVVGTGDALINYHGKTVNFTVGQFIGGLWSGANGTISAVTDHGDGTGVLAINGLVAPPSFVALEPLNDGAGGHALADGPEYYAPYELNTGLTDNRFAGLQWVQSGDVLYFSYPGGQPFTITRVAHANWVLNGLTFPRATGYATASVAGGAYLVDPLPVPTLAEPAKEWLWGVTVVYRDASFGFLSETGLFGITKTTAPATAPTQVAVYQDLPVQLYLPTTGILGTFNGYPVATRIYRGGGTAMGWVGDVAWGITSFTDLGAEPDYLQAPPKGRNPFEVYNGAGALVRTENPAAVGFFQERLLFGGTDQRQGVIFASATGDYLNFDERFVPVAGEALNFELAARKREYIRFFLSLQHLLVFTNSSVWSISGHQGSPLDFDSIDARVVEEIGISYVAPLSVNGCALYARLKGRGVRALIPANLASGFQGVDISNQSQHLFTGIDTNTLPGGTVVDWAYAEDPFGLVWAVMDDGALLSLTFNPQENQWAWARHDTGKRLEGGDFFLDGRVLNVCCVPEGNEDAVYLAVQRQKPDLSTYVTIERMHARASSYPVALDSSRLFRVTNFDSLDIPLTLYGLEHLEGRTDVWVLPGGDNPPQGPLTVTHGSVTLPDVYELPELGAIEMWAGLKFVADLETLDIAAAQMRLKQKTVGRVGIEVNQGKGIATGQDFDHLTDWQQRKVSDGYGNIAAVTELLRINVKGKWDAGARACLRQTLPLPVAVLAIAREVDSGD